MLSSRLQRVLASPVAVEPFLKQQQNMIRQRFLTTSSTSKESSKVMTEAEREAIYLDASRKMASYEEARILAKQGKLKSKRNGQSNNVKSQNAIQMSMLVALTLAFIASPILGKKIAQDEEFRQKYVPAWYDFRVKSPESAWTREELHEQLVQVERDIRERALRGDFTPDKLEEMKRNMQPRRDLSEEDLHYANKYGWGRIHPGVDPDEYDEDNE